MQFRRFNDKGIAAFAEYLDALRTDPRRPVPVDLLDKATLSEPLNPPIQSEPQAFATRMDFACWLHDAAKAAGAEIPRKDAGFWAWLSLALFDEVCPADAKGHRKPHSDLRRFIPTIGSAWGDYKHLLAGPYDAFYQHRDYPARAMAALIKPLNAPGDMSENICGRAEIVGCKTCMYLATKMFVNDSDNTLKKNASGRVVRDLGKYINQVSRTFDMPEVKIHAFIRLLPKKFDKFKPSTVSEASDAAP